MNTAACCAGRKSAVPGNEQTHRGQGGYISASAAGAPTHASMCLVRQSSPAFCATPYELSSWDIVCWDGRPGTTLEQRPASCAYKKALKRSVYLDSCRLGGMRCCAAKPAQCRHLPGDKDMLEAAGCGSPGLAVSSLASSCCRLGLTAEAERLLVQRRTRGLTFLTRLSHGLCSHSCRCC